MSQQDYDVAKMTTQKRISVRQELTQHHDYLSTTADDYGTSKTIVKQYVETAIYALDAVQRLVDLADRFEATDNIVSKAIATEIRNALEGK